MNVQQKRIADRVSKHLGVDVWQNTRKRDYVEGRALLATIYRKYLGMRLADIVRVFRKNNKNCHHATILHALKMYDVYKNYNPKLEDIMNEVVCDSNVSTESVRRMFIKQNLYNINNEVVQEIYELVYNNYKI